MTLFETIELLNTIALKHPNINSVGEGNIYDYMNANPSIKYGVFFITQGSHSQDDMFNHFEFTLFYVDRLISDLDSNRLQIQSIGKETLSNILTFFCEEFDAECESINYQPFTQKFTDLTAGIYATITIDVPKDIICPEEYWDESWSAPVTVIRNQNKSVVFTENGTYTIDYDPSVYTGLGTVTVDVNIDTDSYYESGYTEGYDKGNTDGYSNGYEIGNEEGYTSGKTDGIAEGYADGKEEGLEEGYANGKTDGYNEGYEEGYAVSYDEGYEKGQEDVAANARVIDITENGLYKSKFSDKTLITEPTGVYENGDLFFDYAYLNNIQYNTNIYPMSNTKMEIWWKYDGSVEGNEGCIIGCQKWGYANSIFKIAWNLGDNNLIASINDKSIIIPFIEGWNHIVMSYADGVWNNGVKIGNFPSNITDDMTNKEPICINGYYGNNRINSDYFGMVKIDDVVIIPTENGLLNVNTNELLPIHREGEYTYTSVVPEYDEPTGELYKTINVNVIPKINVAESGLKFGQSTFSEVPEWADFEGVTDLSDMFYNCTSLQTVSLFDTSNVTNMVRMFEKCAKLTTVPLFDTSNVTNMEALFNECTSLQTVPQFDTSNVNRMTYMFFYCHNLTSLPKFDCTKVINTQYYFRYDFFGDLNLLTDVGGWENLSCNWNDNYGLARCPNLTYESCINILNGLYDFVGNGSTETRTLKVHQNFLDTVGDEISIATAKGWSVVS